MRAPRIVYALIFTVLLLAAQLQGVVHGISHLSAERSQHALNISHVAFCSDCAAFAQASAAPLLSHTLAPDGARRDARVSDCAPGSLKTTPSLCYRSRAPPLTALQG